MKLKFSFFILLFACSSAFARMDIDSETISHELSQNSKIQKCYSESASGKLAIKQKAIINVHLEKDGTPTLVAAINSPEQTTDKSLKKCLESIVRSLKYPTQAKNRSEVQIQLVFPANKN